MSVFDTCKAHTIPTAESGVYRAHHDPLVEMSFKVAIDLGARKVELVGSRYVCNPPVLDTDIDILCLWNMVPINGHSFMADWKDMERYLNKHGWVCNREYEQERTVECEFLTARKGKVNLIIYIDDIGYIKFLTAAKVCKALNLTNKADRITAHRAATEYNYFNENVTFGDSIFG